MTSLPLAAALVLYLFSSASFLAQLLTNQARLQRMTHSLLLGGALLHLGGLATRAWVHGTGALAPLPEQLSAIGAGAVLLYLLLSIRSNLLVVGALITPLCFLLTLSAYFFEAGNGATARGIPSVWLPAHVGPVFLGYAVFAVAFCTSLTYLLQERQLKRKRRSDLFRRLPSLETLDELNMRFISWGFALFTIGLVSGSLLAREIWGALWSWEPIQVWSLVTWLLYGVLLQARTVGWRGHKAARLTVLCFLVLAVSFLSVNLLFPGKHGNPGG